MTAVELEPGSRFRPHPRERWRTVTSVSRKGGWVVLTCRFDRSGPVGSVQSAKETRLRPDKIVEVEG